MKKLVIMMKYDITANSYDELYKDEQWEKYNASKNVLADRQPRILCDFGSGTLLFLEYMAQNGLLQNTTYYVALELSRGMINISRKRINSLRKGHIVDIVQADIEYTPLRSLTCSVAVSYTVLDLVDNPLQALEEIRRTSSYAVVSLLKKAQRLKTMMLRGDKYLGETGKDIILEIKNNSVY